MTHVKVFFKSANDIKLFINKLSGYDAAATSGDPANRVNAKSIIGIFSQDLSKPLTLNIDCDHCPEVLDDISEFIVKEDDR